MPLGREMAMAKVPIGRILREGPAMIGACRNQEAVVTSSIAAYVADIRSFARSTVSSPDTQALVIGAPLISVGRWFFGLALLGLGTEHFIFREFVTGRAPAWPAGLPGELAWVY